MPILEPGYVIVVASFSVYLFASIVTSILSQTPFGAIPLTSCANATTDSLAVVILIAVIFSFSIFALATSIALNNGQASVRSIYFTVVASETVIVPLNGLSLLPSPLNRKAGNPSI